jgi:hypothetical protein
VFSTQSSAGHSPWHWNTYFYSRKQNTQLQSQSARYRRGNRAGHGVRSERHPNRSRRHQASRLALAPENGCRAGSCSTCQAGCLSYLRRADAAE